MDLFAVTQDDVDQLLRLELGVDVLALRPPATRVVVFHRRTAALGAEGRRRSLDEPWVDHVVELAFLPRALRARRFAFGLPVRRTGADDAGRFGLQVVTVERGGRSQRYVDLREHPFDLTDDGLPAWYPPTSPSVPSGLEALARATTRRRYRQPRHPRALVEHLAVEQVRNLGHHVELTGALADRVARAAAVVG